ncbi:GroES-like protein [Dichomitus squalens]|uniref:GroES-like protein n=2 Tax=Dichomitus squalens TaxID=114155 RepID=A0A4Q9MKQ2_9APHY|nr:GroES-like protein [Dichomitus squalens LYAD-421 SS1]EJF59297.1 GroES-like protein [Dichomitus squalens LYAD-421 SS1]TBU28099.1 GroES-like protein [Dichomitus squalens]TBU43489.1 GroES-like protein [Dichomitus squalens]TBU60168.1 GroES-like protein [Dichomitus squalens]
MSPIALPTQHAAVLHGAKDMRFEERTLWPPHQGQAQVAVMATGLCGSDLHYYAHGRNGDFVVQAPLVLGHEAAGIVTAVGPGVKNLVPGQRVAIEAGIMCNNCSYCAKGRYNLCKNMRFCSSAKTFPHSDGTLQERMNHPAHVLHPLPDNCTFEQAALAEPLSVLLHAARRAELTPGSRQSVLVFGVGAIGLLACALAKSYGASRVVAIDINQTRLDFALKHGFAEQVHCLPFADKAKTTDEALRRAKENISAALTEFNMPDGFDLVFECTGAEPCIQMSIHAAVTGGKVMLVGMGSRNVTLPLSAAATREVDIHGSFRYAHTYPTALQLLASGKLPNIEKIITHRFALEDTARAFELLQRGRDDEGNMVLKVMVGSQ